MDRTRAGRTQPADRDLRVGGRGPDRRGRADHGGTCRHDRAHRAALGSLHASRHLLRASVFHRNVRRGLGTGGGRALRRDRTVRRAGARRSLAAGRCNRAHRTIVAVGCRALAVCTVGANHAFISRVRRRAGRNTSYRHRGGLRYWDDHGVSGASRAAGSAGGACACAKLCGVRDRDRSRGGDGHRRLHREHHGAGGDRRLRGNGRGAAGARHRGGRGRGGYSGFSQYGQRRGTSCAGNETAAYQSGGQTRNAASARAAISTAGDRRLASGRVRLRFPQRRGAAFGGRREFDRIKARSGEHSADCVACASAS